MDLFGINWYCMIAYLLLFQSFLRFCAIVLLICVFQVPCCIWWWLGNSRIVICNNSDFSQPVHCKHLIWLSQSMVFNLHHGEHQFGNKCLTPPNPLIVMCIYAKLEPSWCSCSQICSNIAYKVQWSTIDTISSKNWRRIIIIIIIMVIVIG